VNHLYIAGVLNSIFAKMSNDAWQTIGNFVNTAGLTGLAVTSAKSVLAGYQAYASPSTSLAESERKLERVRSLLQGLSDEKREEIEAQCRASNRRGLRDLENDLDTCVLLIDAVSFSNPNSWSGL
jgi:hypothetical protein